ncbi:hypothetical protein DFH06DRAFT_1300494 [Mycena polygramma]|nr:hypothetical protein DFH06DRAFT_1300494 [Mycena polygramma]
MTPRESMFTPQNWTQPASMRIIILSRRASPTNRRGEHVTVWTAGVEGTGTTLVLKIIQPSLCPYPAPDRCWTMYEAPEDLARGEAWAYKRIVHKQGLLVPYFFGLDQITTPSGEPVWVLTLEYIPPMTLASFLDSPARSFWDICDLTKLSLDAAEDFGSDGWRHLDPMPDNILVTDCFGARGVVFIDYSFICRLPPSEWSDNYPCEELYHQIVECMDFDVGFQQWADENIAAVRRFNTQWN